MYSRAAVCILAAGTEMVLLLNLFALASVRAFPIIKSRSYATGEFSPRQTSRCTTPRT